ncbi:conserved hypothetical protein [Hyphomicrobiales bacterium]|jgi:hypothetical protein|nr:conserved hypothetical protein [Hyphomicrobiales bacterium]CAH1702917.1 conserved hypothetical protein [Hyphomicrobiales bacterium]CAI0347103.1 conserved hypothetical protein [Hyphomicrobiales bacterium]
MKIVIIADKLSSFRVWALAARTVFPELDLQRSIALTINPYSQRIFAFPKRLNASDFPFAGPPSFTEVDLSIPATYHGTHGAVSTPKVRNFDGAPISMAHSDVVRRMHEADLILDGADPWPSDKAMFDLIWTQTFGDGPEQTIAAPFALDHSAGVTVAALELANKERGRAGVAHLIRYGRSKWRFQFGFTVNSNAILKPLQRAAGCAPDAPPLSPFSLQLLYALRDSGPLSGSKIVDLMSRWSGSGRYPKRGDGSVRMTSFGSPASRLLIIENLQKAGLVTSGDSEPLEVSPTGSRLLEMLHPDCQDPDLSFRLDEWFRLPEPEAQMKVDRYLRTFFGKQMRFQGGLSIG